MSGCARTQNKGGTAGVALADQRASGGHSPFHGAGVTVIDALFWTSRIGHALGTPPYERHMLIGAINLKHLMAGLYSPFGGLHRIHSGHPNRFVQRFKSVCVICIESLFFLGYQIRSDFWCARTSKASRVSPRSAIEPFNINIVLHPELQKVQS